MPQLRTCGQKVGGGQHNAPMTVEVVSRVRAGGSPVERLVGHPQLPLVAGLVSDGDTVHVWDHSSGDLRKVGTISAGTHTVYWWRLAMAWEPDGSLLLAAREGFCGAVGGAARWTPAGISGLGGLPATDAYRDLAFIPDRQALWASPSAGDCMWALSDVVDLDSGVIWAGQRWDTGVAVHPAGGLVATLASEAGASQVLFALVEQVGKAPAAMRLLNRSLILDADGYGAPVFSADGRHLAIRGSSYGYSLAVFEFPSLRLVLSTAPGELFPGYLYQRELHPHAFAWSPHNISFGPQPGVLWVGSLEGRLIECDLDSQQSVSHDVSSGARVTALAATATGGLPVATKDDDLALVSLGADCATAYPAAANTLQSQVAAFLTSASMIPDDRTLWAHLVTTDGVRTWNPDDLATITTASAADPAWLQTRAAGNRARADRWNSD